MLALLARKDNRSVVEVVAFSPKNDLIVSGSADGRIKVWDAGTPSPPDPSPSLSLSAPTLAAASLELKAEKQSAHSNYVLSVAFSPDGKTIVSGSADKTLKVWDAGIPARPIPHLSQT